ncbi:MAG: cohesin domain-containing protein [bacterium]
MPITPANISGFNSSSSAINQPLTIVFSDITTTYAVTINPLVITTPTLTIGSTITTNGSHISVPIMASDFTNSVAGMDLLVSYDSTLLTIDSITPNSTLGGALFNKNYSSHLIYISYLAEMGENFTLDSGVVAILNFTVVSGSDTNTNIVFKTTSPGSKSKLYDKYGSNMSGNFIMGTLAVHPAIPIVPTIKT